MSKAQFKALVKGVVDEIGGRAVDGALQDFLNQRFPADGARFQAIEAMVRQGVAEGWMCEREYGAIRFGRVIDSDPELAGHSIDVVHMDNVVGPHHRHPLGEIDMVMPVDAGARFDGTSRGWKVYGPDSAHCPTVSDGRAYVLYLLPDGQIDFTGKKK